MLQFSKQHVSPRWDERRVRDDDFVFGSTKASEIEKNQSRLIYSIDIDFSFFQSKFPICNRNLMFENQSK